MEYTIQKVTGDNAGEHSRVTFSKDIFEKRILDPKRKEGEMKFRSIYKDWRLIDDIKKVPKSLPEVIDMAIEKKLIVRKGVHYFLGKENIGKNKAELKLTGEQLFEIQSKI